MSGAPDVVVVTYDSAALLPDALGSLPADAHVVVVDNASSDGSAEVAAALGADVIANPVNAGFGAAANRGVAAGSADLVLLLNPDARIDADALAVLCDRLRADPHLAVLSPRLRHPDGREQRVRWPFPSAPRAWREAMGLHRFSGRPRGRGVDDSVGDGGPDGGFVIGACFLMRRAAFEALGGFDERFWLYAEEADLCRRARVAGWSVEVAADVVGRHVGGASGEGSPLVVFEHFERGGEHVVAKADGAAALVSYRLANLTGAAARTVLAGETTPGRRARARARARRLVGVLVRHPTRVALDSPATAAPRQGLVVCSLEAWDGVWRRNQFFVRELLVRDRNRRVLFVEPPFDWVLEVRHRSGRRRRRGLRPLSTDGRIVLFEPAKVWPRVLGGWADRSLRRQVRTAARSLGFVDPALWVNDHHYAALPGETRWPAVYDVTDDWAEAGDGGRAVARVRADERVLLAEAASVVVCSPGLAASRRHARPDLVVIPNAVDPAPFAAPHLRPSDLRAAPVALYVGTLHEDRLDVDLVERLARERPDVAVVLLGPVALTASSQERLVRHPNVHLLGARDHHLVPAYVAHAEVVIVPHVVTPFTESLDPIKAYECLAAGRPTVATPVAGFRDLPPPVVVAEASSFVAAVGDAVDAAPVPSRPQPVPTWAARAEAFDRELGAGWCLPPRWSAVVLDHCARLSGAELALVRLLPALTAAGVDARVVLGEHGPLEERVRATGAEVEVAALDESVATTTRGEVVPGVALLARAAFAACDTLRLARHLRRLQPDVVHTNSLKAALYGGVAGRLAGIPVVWHVRDRIAPDYLPRPAVALVRVAARVLPTAVIANSAATAATLPARTAGRLGAVTVIHDAQLPAPPRRARADAMVTMAMVGRLAPWKGQDVAVRAFAEAFGADADASTAPQVQLSIVGSALFGEEAWEVELRRLVDGLGVADRVRFTGFVDDIEGLLAGVDVVVHASVIPEPFGQVVLEGMAAGAAVVASDAGGPAEIVTDGVDGLLCPPGDVGSLAVALRRLAEDRVLRERLGRAGVARAGDFAPGLVAARVVAVYESALARRGRSPARGRTGSVSGSQHSTPIRRRGV